MKRLILTLSLAATAALGIKLWPASAEPKQAEKKALPECPVMGEPANLFVKADTKDGPVYFCCAHCIEKYNSNPTKYAKQAAAQKKALAALPKVQVSCPVSGEPVDPKVSFEHDGQKVFTCCPKCVDVLKKDFDKYKAKLAASFTYQTKCPLSGEPISPKSFTDFGANQRVYFCCDKCKAKFQADPKKYADQLKEQGYELEIPKKGP